MSREAEWIYEKIIYLPYGWSVIRLKRKFIGRFGGSYRRYNLYHESTVTDATWTYKRVRFWPGQFR